MRHFLQITILVYVLVGCKSRQSDEIIKVIDRNRIEFDIAQLDSLNELDLQPVDTLFFNKYIARNPAILGRNYEMPRHYADGFWIKKYADSIKNDFIFNTFSESKYYILPSSSKIEWINGLIILQAYPTGNIMITEHMALYLIILDNNNPFPHLSTILLAEKIKGGGLSSIDLVTRSILNDSTIEQITIEKSCILDLPKPDGDFPCVYDTTITYYKITDSHIFDPFKRIIKWGM